MIDPSIPRYSLDLGAPDFLADPYPRLAELRRTMPVFFDPVRDRIYVLSYSAIAQILRSRRFGRSILHILSRDELGWPPPDPRQADFDRFESSHMMSKEPPDHTRLRGVVGRAFTPKRVEDLRDRMQAIVADSLDRLATRDRFDLVAEFAEPLPVTVIGEMLGVPPDYRQAMRDWSGEIVKLYEPSATEAEQARANAAVVEFGAYLRGVIAERRAQPGPDLISALVERDEMGERLSEDELISTCILLLNAGHEATVNGTSGAILTLQRHPEAWQQLVDAARTPEIDPLFKTRRRGAAAPRHAAAAVRALGAGGYRDRRRQLPARHAADPALRSRQPRPGEVRRARPARPDARSQPASDLRPRQPFLPGRAAGPAGDADRPARPGPPLPPAAPGRARGCAGLSAGLRDQGIGAVAGGNGLRSKRLTADIEPGSADRFQLRARRRSSNKCATFPSPPHWGGEVG
ncbi:MAG: cytochrome P450 [Aliidongia sp.]